MSSKLKIGLLGFGPHPWPSVERARQFYQQTLESNFDLVHLDNGWVPVDAVLSFRGDRIWKAEHPPCPIIVVMHGGPVINYRALSTLFPRLRADDVITVNCASDVTIVSQLCEVGPTVCHLPLPVDAALFTALDRRRCRDHLSIDHSVRLLGFVGRLIPQKNVHLLMRLLARLRRRLDVPVEALVIGNYWADYGLLPYETAVYQRRLGHMVSALGLSDAIHFFPASLSDDELVLCYSAMDCLFHPTNSIDENFGYVPLEAMACEIPVVGSDYGGLKDSIVDGETGFSMRTWTTNGGIRTDLIAGEEAVIRLLTRPALARRIGRNGRKRAESVYSESRCSNILAEAIVQAIARWRRGPPRPIVLRKAHVCDSLASLLPASNPSWNDFRPAVDSYVSGPMPQFARVVRYADVVPDGAGSFRLDDPAWPAQARLNEDDLALLNACDQPRSLSEFSKEEERSLLRLLESGFLIGSTSA